MIKHAPELTDADLSAVGPIDIRGDITRRRAEAIVAADIAGLPRRPLDQLVEDFAEADVRHLQGR